MDANLLMLSSDTYSCFKERGSCGNLPSETQRRTPLRTTQGPSWGYLKVNYSETLSIFGDKCPQNGSKNEQRAPRTSKGLQERALDAPTKGLLWIWRREDLTLLWHFQWTRCLEWSQPAPRSSGITLIPLLLSLIPLLLSMVVLIIFQKSVGLPSIIRGQ